MSAGSIPKIFGVGLVQHWKEIFFVSEISADPQNPPWGQKFLPQRLKMTLKVLVKFDTKLLKNRNRSTKTRTWRSPERSSGYWDLCQKKKLLFSCNGRFVRWVFVDLFWHLKNITRYFQCISKITRLKIPDCQIFTLSKKLPWQEKSLFFWVFTYSKLPPPPPQGLPVLKVS